MTHLRWLLALALACGAAACDPEDPDDPADAAEDAEVMADGAPEPDAARDAALDAAPDAAPDAGPCECTEIADPVCGIDGITYDNPCFAACAGVDILRPGPCDVPCDCPDVVEPVCGADGETYGNRCRAECAGVEVTSDGPCPEVCGGLLGAVCPDDAWCDYEAGCGFADQQGICHPRPDGCDDVFEPVCGCDGLTYANACEAHRAGADVDAEGECAQCAPEACGPPPGQPSFECPDGSVGGPTGRCLPLEGGACGWEIRECPGGAEPVLCGGFLGDTCAADEYCDFPRPGCDFADANGVCQPRPVACDAVIDPVCGCNGETYDNLCRAHMAGVDAAAEGACPDADACAPPACGPEPGLPNRMCEDGSIGGPTGRCLRGPDGQCGWEIRQCPEDGR